MADEESEPSFLTDVRVKFVEENVCGLLRLRRETWEKIAVHEDFQASLRNFFETELVIFFSLSNQYRLVSYKEV